MASEFSQIEEQKNALNNIDKEAQSSEKMSIAEAIDKLSEIVKKNESCMAQAFANAPEWQQRAQMTMTTFNDGKAKKNSHAVVNIPSTFTKEQKDALKEYATQMGGTFTNMKVVEHGPDGKECLSYPARIEFGKDAAYTPEVCAKMLLGEKKEDIIKVILDSNAAANKQKQITKQDKEKKISNSEENKRNAQKKSNLKL